MIFISTYILYLCLYSYDTEALNKQIQTSMDNEMFINSFQTASHKKVIHGIQQLYIIGNIIFFSSIYIIHPRFLI
jgi:hypothetical protein